jgi:glycosyltransferase involved in cell wall biosynthesis
MSDSVLIVIPTLNESKHIVSVLDSISARLPANTTIVVADGGSDDTAQKVQHYARQHAYVKLLHNPQKIQSAAVNLAVEKFGLGTEYVIRCDAHAIYPANFISALIETINDMMQTRWWFRWTPVAKAAFKMQLPGFPTADRLWRFSPPWWQFQWLCRSWSSCHFQNGFFHTEQRLRRHLHP